MRKLGIALLIFLACLILGIIIELKTVPEPK